MRRGLALLAVVLVGLALALAVLLRGSGGSAAQLAPAALPAAPAAAPRIAEPGTRVDPLADSRAEAGSTGLAAPPARALASGLASLSAHLVDEHGADQPNGLYLLMPLDPQGAPRLRSTWREKVTDANGRLHETELELGAWRVLVAPTYRAPLATDVVLQPGENDLGDVEFPALVEAGSVKVRLDDPRHDDRAWGVLSIRSADGLSVDRWNWIGSPSQRRIRRYVELPHRFEFEHLPEGPYDVTFFPGDGLRVLEHSRRVYVGPFPGDEIAFELVDDGEPLGLVVRARDAATHEPIERVTLVRVEQSGAPPLVLATRFGEREHELPREVGRVWIVLAAAHRPLVVGASAFQARQGALVLEGELEPGFGALVIGRDADALCTVPGVGHENDLRRDRSPLLASVQIFADRTFVADTDGGGFCLVRLDAPPGELLALADGRVLVDAENLADGKLVDPARPVSVWFASAR